MLLLVIALGEPTGHPSFRSWPDALQLNFAETGLLKTSFWPDGGRGKAAPEALRGIAPGTPIGGLAPPGPKRGGARCTALTDIAQRTTAGTR